MNFSQIIIYFSLLLFAPFILQAQVRGVCGTSVEDQQVIVEKITEFQKLMSEGDASIRSMDDIYIPVKFHSVGMNDGTGRVVVSAILDQLDKLNKDYKDYGMQFYFSEDFGEIDHTGIFSNPPGNEGAMAGMRAFNAMNIFITDVAVPDPGTAGTVLGYWSEQNDLIVIIKNELVNKTNSLSHEAGHFFYLAHTFLGWEVHPYDPSRDGNPLSNQNSPGYNSVPSYNGPQAENQDMSNCMQAADRVCDTPPDYNFGFGTAICNYPDDLTRDFNSDFVMPQENNQMSYFLSGCDSNVFSPDQTDLMMVSYNSPRYTYLRTGYVPNIVESLDMAVLTLPGFGEELDHNTGIYLVWEPVTDAERYLVEVIQGTEYQYFITEETTIIVNDLIPNADVIWKVRPYTELYTGTDATIGIFKTGSGASAVDDIEAFDNLAIFPNPSNGSNVINVSVTSSERMEANLQIIDISGKAVVVKNMSILSGDNMLSLDLVGISEGIYIMSIETTYGTINRKVVIQ